MELVQKRKTTHFYKIYSREIDRILYAILLNLTMISVVVKGVIPELIGTAAFLMLFICSMNIKTEKKGSIIRNIDKLMCIFLFVFLVYFAIQIVGNKFDFWEFILWRGTTRCVFALFIVWFCVRKYFALGFGIHTLLPALIIMNIAQLIFIYSGVEFFNWFNASWNYLGAVDIVLFPFVFRFSKRVKKFERFLFCALFLFVILSMGSRSVLFVSIVLFLCMAILERNRTYKRIFLSSILLFVMILAFLLITQTPAILRALTVFGEGHVDTTREALIEYAKIDFNNKTLFGQLFGDGNTQVSQLVDFSVHNFLWELMLAYGYVGCALLFGFYIILAILIMKSKCKYKWYLMLFGICAILINYYQPFMTSGFLYQFLFFFGGCELYLLNGVKKGRKI